MQADVGQLRQTDVTWATNAGGCYLDNYGWRMLLGQLTQMDVTWATNAGGCYFDN